MENFKSKLHQNKFNESGSVSAKCPSNIALIKYWGKRETQIPMNPSLSFTLTESFTDTELRFTPKATKDFDVEVYLSGELRTDFVPKILNFFKRIEEFVPFLRNFSFEIHTKNTFPHSSGIASSASGMGALALCLVGLEEHLGAEFQKEEKLRKASFLARLGSGSACRSIYPGITVWGSSNFVEGSSDLFAVPYPYEVHEVYENFCDTILLIDEGEKAVSSTVGHGLMNNHPYAKRRFTSANENLSQIIDSLKTGDLEEFGRIVEHEALSLHAMMMTSNPYFILMKPKTLEAIESIWEFRRETSLPLYFTLDAGANVHLLYPKKDKIEINRFIESELRIKCSNKKMIKDYMN